jgi:hypothetical protein
MSKCKYDVTKVSREALEDLAKIVCNAYAKPETISVVLPLRSRDVCPPPAEAALKVIEQALVKLRTKAEVDQDIAQAVREYAAIQLRAYGEYPEAYDGHFRQGQFPELMKKLLKEETDG